MIMTVLERPRPNDQRGFVHKRLLGAVGGFVASGGNPLGAASGFVRGGGRRPAVRPPMRGFGIPSRTSVAPLPARRPPPRTTTARPSLRSAGEKEQGRFQKFGVTALAPLALAAGTPCWVPGARPDPCNPGKCAIFAGDKPGPDDEPCPGDGVTPTGGPVGEAVMGQYGAALQPGSLMINRAVCLTGMQLGNDGLCYNKGAISNRQRMWPAGRKPLLSGGDMRAISIAARAGKRLEGATKRLQAIGLMKKPSSRGRAPARGRALTVKEAGQGSVTVQ